VIERAGHEPGVPPAIVFNGDFHWLDLDPEDFQAISETVLAHHATKGNVEAELASDEDAGCGCAYPDYVGDEVDRSNQIMTRLRATARQFPHVVRRPGDLPRHVTASVAGHRVGIIHGDPESLAGWRLALEAMERSAAARRRDQEQDSLSGRAHRSCSAGIRPMTTSAAVGKAARQRGLTW
jgi:hypothetical protein